MLPRTLLASLDCTADRVPLDSLLCMQAHQQLAHTARVHGRRWLRLREEVLRSHENPEKLFAGRPDTSSTTWINDHIRSILQVREHISVFSA